MKNNIEIKCSHEKKDRLKISQKFSLCFHCSCALIKNDDSNNEIYTIKPLEYSISQENSTPIFLSISYKYNSYTFKNKQDYIKVRPLFIKQMKTFCNYFYLSKKTFYLSLDYFDRICSKMISFDFEALKQICQFCVILASKFQETAIKGFEIKRFVGGSSENYSKDELYLLQLLDYDLHAFTAYDILMDFLHCGFLFSDEKFSIKKMNNIYGKIENILYLFSESKYYIDMTHKEIALSIIGLIREILGLVSFNKIIINIFMNNYTELQIYLLCLKKLKKCFKFADNSENNNDNNNNLNDIPGSISEITSQNCFQNSNLNNDDLIKEKDAIRNSSNL